MKYTIVVYAPVDACEKVKQAMFCAGGGALGCYDQCAWQVLGQGQFRPLSGSQPAIGQQDQVTKLDEYRIEMLCEKRYLSAVVKAMKESHPYEEVAYQVFQIVDV